MDLNSDPSLPRRPLDPPPLAERTWVKWIVILLALNLMGMVWLGIRTESPEYLRKVLDFLFQIGVGGLATYVAFRILNLFSFRMLDLIAIVMVLSLGVKFTIDVLEKFLRASKMWIDLEQNKLELGTILQTCMFTSSVLLAGAAMDCGTVRA